MESRLTNCPDSILNDAILDCKFSADIASQRPDYHKKWN